LPTEDKGVILGGSNDFLRGLQYGDSEENISAPETVRVDDGDNCDGSLRVFLLEQARSLLELTMTAEVEDFLRRHADLTDEDGRPAVVRNGYHPERQFLTHLGLVPVRIPKVRSRIERQAAFRSMLVRPYLRRCHASDQGAAWRFLRALGSGDVPEAMRALMGLEALTLPPGVMTTLSARWRSEHGICLTGSLAQLSYRSMWIESLGGDRWRCDAAAAMSVAVGIDQHDAQKRLLLTADSSSETAQSWVGRLCRLHERGLPPPARVRLGPGVASQVLEAVARVYPQGTQIS
jgi:putative transposase